MSANHVRLLLEMDQTAQRFRPSFERFALWSVVAFSLVMGSIRLLDGIPLGIDSTSHLFRVMLMAKSFQDYGYLPHWNPYWYGGTTLFLRYPPLSYYLVFFLSLFGTGPILAYKIVDVSFYLLGTVGIYCLSRDFRLDKNISIWASFLFSFSPSIVDNFLFYDRFPSIVSLPFVCIFIMVLSRALDRRHRLLWLSISGFVFGAIVLIHHLSALLAAAIGFLFAIEKASANRKKNHVGSPFFVLIGVISAGLVLSSFWTFPFVEAWNYFADNPFFNRNVEFPFIRLSYFSVDVSTYALGLAQLGLCLFALSITCFASGKKRWLIPVTAAGMLAGMGMFELGEKLTSQPTRVTGQVIVIFSLLALLLIAVRNQGDSSLLFGRRFLTLWFVVFFSLSLGELALPVVAIPPFSLIWRALDVHRFWLYLTIPMCILGAVGFKRLLPNKIRLFGGKRWLVPVFLVVVVMSSGSLKMFYRVTHDVSEFLPYPTVNRDIPPALVAYFRSDPSYARILGIRCPLWIYVLPYFTDKPLIDGWYPQEKLVKYVRDINDYRMIDLECAGSDVNRTRMWRGLIDNSTLLAIKWVVVGNITDETRQSLFNGTSFELDAAFPYPEGTITVYRSSEPIQLAEIVPPGTGKISLIRLGPDRISLKLTDLRNASEVAIKEAYFPSWHAVSANTILQVSGDPNGFMRIRITFESGEVLVYQEPFDRNAHYVSAATVVVMIFLAVQGFLHRKLSLKVRSSG